MLYLSYTLSLSLLRTQVIFSVSSPSGDATVMDEESLQAVVAHLNSPAVSSLRFGHHERKSGIYIATLREIIILYTHMYAAQLGSH